MAVQYVDILECAIVPLYNHYQNQRHTFLYFQQDNDSKHTLKLAKAWFRNQGIAVFPWPAKSLDLSPIENAWAHSKSKVWQHPCYSRGAVCGRAFQSGA
jgi:hypothetical protein